MKKDIYKEGGKIIVKKYKEKMDFFWILSTGKFKGSYYLLTRDYEPTTYSYFYNREVSLGELGNYRNWKKPKYRDLNKLIEHTFPLQLRYVKQEFMCPA